MTNDQDWKSKLSAEEYRICREKGTEPPFSGEYNDNHRNGTYHCKCCGEALFASENKYDSGCGWPSFDEPKNQTAIHHEDDTSLGTTRVEVTCEKCGCHLGHVFDDGPADTSGQRFCVNSLSLNFKEK